MSLGMASGSSAGRFCEAAGKKLVPEYISTSLKVSQKLGQGVSWSEQGHVTKKLG
jgi:hypothetical protein